MSPQVVLTTDVALKKYRSKDMCAAIYAVEHDQLKAEKQFNILWQTLRDRVSGRVTQETKPGPYSLREESEFAEFLVDSAKAGLGKSRQQIRQLMKNFSK